MEEETRLPTSKTGQCQKYYLWSDFCMPKATVTEIHKKWVDVKDSTKKIPGPLAVKCSWCKAIRFWSQVKQLPPQVCPAFDLLWPLEQIWNRHCSAHIKDLPVWMSCTANMLIIKSWNPSTNTEMILPWIFFWRITLSLRRPNIGLLKKNSCGKGLFWDIFTALHFYNCCIVCWIFCK